MDVVKTIDAAGYEAKGQESPKSLHEIFLVQQVVAEEQWGEYKGILKPLQGAQKHQSILHLMTKVTNKFQLSIINSQLFCIFVFDLSLLTDVGLHTQIRNEDRI
jgi:hypothetical protein